MADEPARFGITQAAELILAPDDWDAVEALAADAAHTTTARALTQARGWAADFLREASTQGRTFEEAAHGVIEHAVEEVAEAVEAAVSEAVRTGLGSAALRAKLAAGPNWTTPDPACVWPGPRGLGGGEGGS